MALTNRKKGLKNGVSRRGPAFRRGPKAHIFMAGGFGAAAVQGKTGQGQEVGISVHFLMALGILPRV